MSKLIKFGWSPVLGTSLAACHLTTNDLVCGSPLFTVSSRFIKRSSFFTGDSPTSNSDTLVATWIFPPFLGYTVSTNNSCVAIYAYVFCGSYYVAGTARAVNRAVYGSDRPVDG